MKFSTRRFLTLVHGGNLIHETLTDLTDDQVIAVDAFLRYAGLIGEDTEVCVTEIDIAATS